MIIICSVRTSCRFIYKAYSNITVEKKRKNGIGNLIYMHLLDLSSCTQNGGIAWKMSQIEYKKPISK